MSLINDLSKHLIKSEKKYDEAYALRKILTKDDKPEELYTVLEELEEIMDVDGVDPEELAKGIKIEKEHTANIESPTISDKVARQIALDHLAEIPDYYTRLIAMEKDAGVE